MTNEIQQNQYCILEMEGRSLQDFLEVSINMQKFHLFTNAITASLANHERQLQQHTKDIAQLSLSVDDRFTRIKTQLQFQSQKSDRKRKEDNIHFTGLMNDINKKYDVLSDDVKERLESLEQKAEKHQQQEEIVDKAKEEMQEVVSKQMKVLEEQISLIEMQMKTLDNSVKKSISSQDFLLKNVVEAYDSKQKHQTENKSEIKQIVPNKIRKNNYQQIRSSGVKTPEKDNSPEQSNLREAQQRRRKKAQEKSQLQNLQYASITAKVQELQQRLQKKQNQSLNKIIYANKTINNMITEHSQQSSDKRLPSVDLDRMDFSHHQIEQNITEKLQNIESIIQDKLAGCNKETDRLKAKIDLLTDQVEIVIRKFERQKNRNAQFLLQLKKVEERKMDDKIVDGLVTMLKKQGQQLEQAIDKKLQKNIWEKQFPKVYQKLQIISQAMEEKADREEIKRAFSFVQGKIKEIVMLMAIDMQNEKQGAGKRLPFKCLSCDKELQNSAQSSQRSNNAAKNMLNRCQTSSNLRKKVRVGPMESR